MKYILTANMRWEVSAVRMGIRKWVCWSAGCWVTYRKAEPAIVHIGFNKEYLGVWELSPDAARAKLEEMHVKRLQEN